MKSFRLKILMSLLLLSFNFLSCEKDETNYSSSGYEEHVKTTIVGLIVNENNLPVDNARITIYNKTGYTNNFGIFTIKDVMVPKERCLIHIVENSFFDDVTAVKPVKEGITYMKKVMISSSINGNINSSSAHTINLDGGTTIQLPANGYVDKDGNPYTGSVLVKGKFLNPAIDNFSLMIPGGDLQAQNINGESVVLYSLGMAKLQLRTNNGEPLNLAPGVTATLTFPIDPSQQNMAPQQIPIWHFDENTALWKEEGIASRSGNNYIFTVNHFSWWNCDQPEKAAYIKGKVIDCSGAPISNVVVNINSMFSVVTDNLGNYQATVLANTSFPVQVLASQNNGLFQNSQIEIVPPTGPQQYYSVPDLVIPCTAKISGTIGCNGSPGTATIVATWNGGQHFIYCDNGAFVIDVPASSTVLLRFYNSQTMLTQTVNTGSWETSNNIGNIILCGTSSTVYSNGFYIDGGSFVNQCIEIDTIFARAEEPNGFWVNIYGINLATGMPVSVSFGLQDTLAQTYPFDYLNANPSFMSIGGLGFNQTISSSTQGNVELLQWSPRAKGTFNGIFYGSNGSIYSVFNGKFDVPTTY